MYTIISQVLADAFVIIYCHGNRDPRSTNTHFRFSIVTFHYLHTLFMVIFYDLLKFLYCVRLSQLQI